MTLLIKAIIILLFVFIFFSLGSALYYLVRNKNNNNNNDSARVLKALTWRIALSIVVFIILLIAFAMGWIHPHPI